MFKQRLNFACVAVGIFAIGACSTKEHQPAAASKGDLLAGIIHGVVISEETRPEVVKVSLGSGFCTAVFVGANPPTILTASHCLKTLPTSEVNDGGITFKGFKSRRACVPQGAIAKVNPYDMAVVVFDEGAFEVPGLATVSDEDPVAGSSVTLVGYGRNTGKDGAVVTGAGKKRLGVNTVNRIVSGKPAAFTGMIELLGKLDGDISQEQLSQDHDSSPNHGDSGGPLFLKLARGGDAVVGLVSGGHVDGDVATAFYTNLRTQDSRAFLDRALDTRFIKNMAQQKTQADYTDVCAVRD